jgi:ABC-type branched-subunit amino acid transport system substrate-binding protein
MLRFPFAALCAIALLVSPSADAARRRAVGAAETIVVGGLFSLTGDGASLGKASEAALELAARDINAELQALRLLYRVETEVFDTKLTPAGALEGIKALH